jgi:polysaccharide export outer membrane protein
MPVDYNIRAGDEISMQVLSNNGYALVDIIGQGNSTTPISFIVRTSGYLKLPLLDSLKVINESIIALEDTLEKKYSYYFINPFVKVSLKTAFVTVFKGRGSGSQAYLKHPNIELVDFLSESGGLSGNKAFRVKVIRGKIDSPKVYLFDFSTLEGYKKSHFIVQPYDIVYIEPSLTVADISQRIVTTLSLFTTLLLVYNTFSKGTK